MREECLCNPTIFHRCQYCLSDDQIDVFKLQLECPQHFLVFFDLKTLNEMLLESY